MAWQGEIRDHNSRAGVRRLFIVRDGSRRNAEGRAFYWGVSERAGLTELRRVANGTKVWIACYGRSKTATIINGEQVFKLMLEVLAERLSDKPVPFAAASSSPSRAAADDDIPPPSDDDVPF